MTVIARRWDGLGGRIGAILNAWALAKAIGAEFRFAWPTPRGMEDLANPEALFSSDFLGNFLASADIGPALVVKREKPVLPLSYYRQAHSANGAIAVELSFQPLAFSDEGAGHARGRLARAFDEIGWSPVVSDLIKHARGSPCWRRYNAIHVRAGDIVYGDWRQFVPAEKYTPSCINEEMIRRWHLEAETILVVSDNSDYRSYLMAEFPFLRSPQDFLPAYDSLNQIQKDFAETLLLSGAKKILCPLNSGFSRVAMMMHDAVVETTTPSTALSTDDYLAVAGIDAAASVSMVTRPVFPSWNAMKARDTCWLLDVAGIELSDGHRVEMAELAVRLDPEFCASHARLALHGQRTIDRGRLTVARGRAVALASAMRWRHDDPLFDSMACIVTSLIGETLQAAGRAPERTSIVSRTIEHIRLDAGLRDIGRKLAFLGKLGPLQIGRREVTVALEHQVLLLRWLVSGGSGKNPLKRAFLENFNTREPDYRAWLPPGLAILGNDSTFPATLRNVELMSIRMADALAASVAGIEESTTCTAIPHETEQSSTGLAWIRASTIPRDRAGRLAVCMSGGQVLSGWCIPRRTFAASMQTGSRRPPSISVPVPLGIMPQLFVI